MLLLLVPVLAMVFTLRGSGAQSVTQPDRHVLVSEGAPLQLRCSYSSSVSPYLFWYQQRPSQGPQLLLKYASGATLVTGISGFQAELRKNETSFHLRKPSAHWSDSAEYFCALGGTVPGLQGELSTNLLTQGLSVTHRLKLGSFQEVFLFCAAQEDRVA
uniref:Ig-like domain-containing protein n=1 Tax=Spermophilus dauricus TaxID=99837 RepID=A0A8C9Q6F7_SPEDA